MQFSASVRDLRYRFPEIEKRLKRGETIEIRKRQKLVGRLIPAEPAVPEPYPDFAGRLRQISRGKVLPLSATELLRQGRDGG